MPDAPPAPLQFKDLITEAGLADRGWVKDFADKPLDKESSLALLKKLDGAETLIGKKRGIPENDDPKAWDEFLGKLRPGSPDEYKFEVGEGADQEFLKEFRAASHHAGLSNKQIERQVSKLIPALKAKAEQQKAAVAKRDTDYENFVKEMTGGADFAKRQERVKAAARELLPEAARGFIDKLGEKELALFAVFSDAILSKYAGEDEFQGGGGGGGGAGGDKAALTEEMNKILASKEWTDFRHAGHEAAKKRFEEVSKKIAELTE